MHSFCGPLPVCRERIRSFFRLLLILDETVVKRAKDDMPKPFNDTFSMNNGVAIPFSGKIPFLPAGEQPTFSGS